MRPSSARCACNERGFPGAACSARDVGCGLPTLEVAGEVTGGEERPPSLVGVGVVRSSPLAEVLDAV